MMLAITETLTRNGQATTGMPTMATTTNTAPRKNIGSLTGKDFGKDTLRHIAATAATESGLR
jgi:hypothetical protein